jgi:hypothetical protein
VRHASKSGGLLHLKASRVRVSQSDFKIGVGTIIGDACGTIAEVALGSS